MESSTHQQQPTKRENAPVTDSDIHATLDLHATQEITKFDDEVPAQVAAVPHQPPMPIPNDPFPDQALVDFLQRPRVVHSFKWLSSATAGACLARLAFPDELFASPTVWNKVQQFVYLHAGLHFSVRVNGTPFHYGQLLVAWRPACLGRTVYTSTTNPGVYDNFYSVAQYPHMLVSPSSAQVVEMSVPYEVPLDNIPIKSYSEVLNDNTLREFSSQGFLEFWVLTPLRGQGATNSEPPVTVSLFANFTSPRLTGFTHAQYNFMQLTYNSPANPPKPSALRYPVQITQAGEDDLPEVSETHKHPVNQVPLPIAFIPAKTSSTTNHAPTTQLSLNEKSIPILNKKKRTKISDHLKVWSLLYQYNLASNSELNSVIASFYVHPGNCATGTHNNTTVFFNTKLSYLANLFSLWRGPIEYRFDFIASKFHSCRVKIAWYPPNTTEVAGNEELPDAWTQIVDVQGQISATFTVPWLQSTSWLTLTSPGNYRSANGVIVLTLLNSLSYPTLNGPPISINCWVRAPDIQFAAYTQQDTVHNSFFTGSSNTGTLETPMFSITAPASETPAVSSTTKQKVTQAGESAIKPVNLDDLPMKPSFVGILTPNGKIFITPPIPEPIPAAEKAQRSVRMNTLLDYLCMLHLGYYGSTRLACLNPQSEIFFVPRIGSFSALEHTFKSSTTFPNRIKENIHTASSYYPSSVNSVKDVVLPNYTSLLYRPTIVETYRVRTSSSICLPGVDIYNLSDKTSLVTLASADDFEFIGMAPAPLTW